jgi:hypothetical protein
MHPYIIEYRTASPIDQSRIEHHRATKPGMKLIAAFTRDKIYGVLSLSSHLANVVPTPNYQIPGKDLCTSMFQSFV